MSEPTIICVLGMHRSGTSLVTRVLHELGIDLGPPEHLMRPSSANPTGHWESRPIAELNEEILARLGGTWAKPPELAPGWERSSELDGARREARELVEADFSGSSVWGFKDPRNSLTLPFWQGILPPMRYVICLRNPVDVAASLKARKEERVPLDQGVDLWFRYVRGALSSTAGHPRELLFYEDVMADPEPVVGRLARFIGRPSSDDDPGEEVRVAIGVALTEGLWHHRTGTANVVDAGGVPFHVKALYLALRQFVPSAESVETEVLDLVGHYADSAGRRLAKFAAVQSEVEQLRERVQGLERERAELEPLREQVRDLERDRAGLEQRLAEHHELEAELDKTRAELRRVEASQRSSISEHEQATEGAAVLTAAAENPSLAEVRARATEVIPAGATVLVAAKGDDALLRLDGRRAWHFPMAADGRYLGYHPSGDTAVIAQLEALRARGADHLLLPATTLWWLDHYEGFRRHLEDRYVSLLEDEHCAIYRLSAADRARGSEPFAVLERAAASFRTRSGRDPSILDMRTGLGIATRLPELPVFAPLGEDAALPYLDETVDIVVVSTTDAARIAEARRVAASAVIRVDPNTFERAELDWAENAPRGWGEEVCVALLPDTNGSSWDATAGAFAETLGDGFAGELAVVTTSMEVGAVGERTAAAGVRLRPLEAPPGASLADRARVAIETTDARIHVFVSAPAVPLPDWLPSIVALFSPSRNAGVVAARNLADDGSLEAAGGLLGPDGSPRRRGEGDPNPDRPEYCFVRAVDFCSPPVLATRREVFERLGGFDERGGARADAMVDFSLRAGQAGTGVYYQPQARVVTIGEGVR